GGAGAQRGLSRVVVMARRALARESDEVAVAMAVGARERAVQAGQVTADAGGIEPRRGERPLRVALAAARRQRVAVDVVLAVAVDAQVAAAGERPVIAVAALARDVVVHALEREVANVVQRLDVFPRSRGVALRAAGAVLAAVHLGLGVTAEAVG